MGGKRCMVRCCDYAHWLHILSWLIAQFNVELFPKWAIKRFPQGLKWELHVDLFQFGVQQDLHMWWGNSDDGNTSSMWATGLLTILRSTSYIPLKGVWILHTAIQKKICQYSASHSHIDSLSSVIYRLPLAYSARRIYERNEDKPKAYHR